VARGVGGRPPYAAVILTIGLTEDPILSGYIRGKLALAGIDLSVEIGTWLDAVWACAMDAPYNELKAANAEMTKAMARVRPEQARATWGMLPEHQVQAGRLGRGPGLESGAADLPPSAGGRTAADIDRWTQERLKKRPARR
jgi:hypothetical protein